MAKVVQNVTVNILIPYKYTYMYDILLAIEDMPN